MNNNISKIIVSYGGGMGGCSWTIHILNFEKPKDGENIKLYNDRGLLYEINPAFIVYYEYNYNIENMTHLGNKNDIQKNLNKYKDTKLKNIVV